MRKALITGVNGQDGSYLAELLLNHGYQVVGTVRKRQSGVRDHDFINRVPHAVEVVDSDLLEGDAVENLLHRFRPNEIYNLAARASSSDLWTEPVCATELNALAVMRLLDAIHRVDPSIHFVQASSSEVFGSAAE